MAAKTEPAINILLVDDQPANLLALQSLLQHPDYNLVTARSGQEALRAMLKQEFALVLLDVLMPGLDGLETAAMLRQRERTTYTPIIFITAASAGDREVVKGYELGAVDYIFKPIVPEILRAKVQVFVELYRRAERIKAQTLELQSAQTELRRELAEHLRAEKALRESEEKYRLLFSGAREAIIVFDKRSRQLLDANDAAARLYGHSRAALLQLSADDLFLDPAAGEAPPLGSKSALHARELAATQRSSDGRQFPAELTHAAFALKGRELVIVLVRDVTERRRSEDTERLLARDAMQREFVATVSHELRTPIAAIKGFAETLRLGGLEDPKNRMRFIRIIEKHADKLGWLVEDILTLNAMESGKMKPRPEEFPLREFVERVIEGLSPIAARRTVAVTVGIAPALRVFADARQTARILQNLLDNAIKYNVRGGSIRIEAAPEGKHVHVVVRDTGIGIAAHDLPLIFQQFHRSETAKAMQVRGSGLGLYIIKSIVESNGGQIWALSDPGKGSEFHFTLPAAPEEKPARAEKTREQLAERPQ
jgi:PAS domain S-box-containing protein